MGDSISEGVVKEWLKKPGDAVAADEPIVVLETDKTNIDVRAPVAGVFEEGLAPVDATVPIGADLFKLKAGAVAAAPATAPKAEAPKTEAPAAPAAAPAGPKLTGKKVAVKVPPLAESIKSGLVKEILVKPGQGVKADQIVLSIETDKTTIDVSTPTSGVINIVKVQKDQEVFVGDEVIEVLEGSAPVEAPKVEAPKPAAPTPAAAAAAPAAKPASAAAAKPATPAAPARPVATASGPVERIDTRQRMSQARKRTAQRLKDSQNTAAILTTFNEVDMYNLMEMREKYKDRFLERFGVKLGFMSAFAKASAIALQENPVVNAVMDGDDIIYRNYVDISVAVSTPTSLVVPVLRNVERMSFADIERQIGEFGVKAKEGKLTIEEMSGGTFTISNGGVFGSLMGTPIINPPQSAILGMHAINKRAHVVNDKVEVRPIMYIALSYDHRIIDGREAVTTLKRIKTLIEDPVSMLLDL